MANADLTCTVDGCELPTDSRGWCSRHYQRWRMSGDVGPAGPLRVPQAGCSAEGCDRPHKAKGLCANHYIAMWRRQTGRH